MGDAKVCPKCGGKVYEVRESAVASRTAQSMVDLTIKPEIERSMFISGNVAVVKRNGDIYLFENFEENAVIEAVLQDNVDDLKASAGRLSKESAVRAHAVLGEVL